MADVMESVRLLIDIPKSVYENFTNNCYTRNDIIAIHNTIYFAQKVQRGHGRLIDADALIKTYEGYIGYDEEIQAIKDAQTIIRRDECDD